MNSVGRKRRFERGREADAESDEASLSKPLPKADGIAVGGRGRRRFAEVDSVGSESGFVGGSGLVAEFDVGVSGCGAGFEN